MHTVIFTGGRLRDGKAVRRALSDANMVIVAGSGASTALGMGSTPSVVIGDFDSLGPRHRAGLDAKGVFALAVALYVVVLATTHTRINVL